jgi:hypothetical protein
MLVPKSRELDKDVKEMENISASPMQIAWRSVHQEEFNQNNLDAVNSSGSDDANTCNVVLDLAQRGEEARLPRCLLAPENVHVNFWG